MQNKRVRPARRLAVAMALMLGFAVVVGTASSASAARPDSTQPSKTLVTRQVTVERSGGLIGETVTFVVDATNTHPDAPRLLTLAASPEFVALGRVYLPEITCCDFFSYRVTVSYTIGTVKAVRTMDGAEAPAVLWDVITATQAIGGITAAAA